MKKWLKDNLPEWAVDILAAVIILGALGVIGWILHDEVKADWGFYEGPTVFLGTEYNPRATVCTKDGQWAGQGGIFQPFWRTDFQGGEGRAVLTWTHHSCAFDDDARSYDGIGARMEWRIW